MMSCRYFSLRATQKGSRTAKCAVLYMEQVFPLSYYSLPFEAEKMDLCASLGELT